MPPLVVFRINAGGKLSLLASLSVECEVVPTRRAGTMAMVDLTGLYFVKHERQMASFCEYSFFRLCHRMAHTECRMKNAECRMRGLPISNFQLPIGGTPNHRNKKTLNPCFQFATGFALALFFQRHFFVSPCAASSYAICNWLCLVRALFHTRLFLFLALARGAIPAFIYNQ